MKKVIEEKIFDRIIELAKKGKAITFEPDMYTNNSVTVSVSDKGRYRLGYEKKEHTHTTPNCTWEHLTKHIHNWLEKQ